MEYFKFIDNIALQLSIDVVAAKGRDNLVEKLLRSLMNLFHYCIIIEAPFFEHTWCSPPPFCSPFV